MKQLKRELTFLQKEVQACVEEGDFKFAKYYQKAMWCTQWQLDQLNSFTGKTYYLDQQEIDTALIELNEGTIAGFSILFQPFQEIYLHFSLTIEKEILCQLPTKEELDEFYGYPSKLKKHIRALGFEKAGPDNRLSIQFKLPTNKSCIDIKEKLSLLLVNVLQISAMHKLVCIKRAKVDCQVSANAGHTSIEGIG